MSLIDISILTRPNILRKAQAALDRKGQELVMKVANETMRIAKLRVPVRTGLLRSTHGTRYKGRTGLTLRAEVHAGNVTAFYAPYVHYGTSKQAPQPWLDEAVEEILNWGYADAVGPEWGEFVTAMRFA